MLGMTIACALPLMLRRPCGNESTQSNKLNVSSLAIRFSPLVAPALLAVVWLAPGSSARSIGATLWEPRFLALVEIPGLLLASSGADHAAWLFGALMLGLVAVSLGRPAREPERWGPFLVVLLGYCLFPVSLSGFSPLHPRFAAFFMPALLIAFEPRKVSVVPKLPLLVAATVVGWLCLFTLRLHAFAAETRAITAFVDRMPKGLRVRPIVFEPMTSIYPALPVLMHMSAYYAAEKGGSQGYSFAMYPTSVIRYAPWVRPAMGSGDEWHPDHFSARVELDSYDCFLVHSIHDRTLETFGERFPEVELAFHEQQWWAYRTRRNLELQPVGDTKETEQHGARLAFRDSR
jgi:hypothetical protein